MIQGNGQSKGDSVKYPVFVVSHSQQEAVCKEIYEDLICRKLQKLKDAVLHFNQVIRRILK